MSGSPEHNQGHRHDRGHRDNRDSRGTVLLLFPAAVLVMIVLGALVIDVGVTNLRGRELGAVAETAPQWVSLWLALAQLEAEGQATLAIEGEPIAFSREEIAVTLQVDVDLVLVPAIGDLDRITLTRTGRVVILEE